jgi:prolyl-tRNA synthetase
MRWTKTLIPTLRQTPAEAVVPSHQLMLRAGLIQQVAAGAYSYLPLGWRALHKAMKIVREEMDRAGASEVFLPTLQPVEWWEQTGRRAAYGENLFVVVDRHGREQAMGPTHEEVMTQLIGAYIESYKQLPLTLYQIQTKFRDEFRPRFGVLRSREFQMKDAYSFHLDLESLTETYEGLRVAYRNIFTRCGLKFVEVEAEAGPIGGNASHEFMVPCPTGEDTILSDDQSDYAANAEKCEIGPRKVSAIFAPFSRTAQPSVIVDTSEPAAPTGALEKVKTPGAASIEDVCAYFKRELGTKLKPQNMLKTLAFQWKSSLGHYDWGGGQGLAVVRGDHELNGGKLKKVVEDAGIEADGIQLMDSDTMKKWDVPVGFVGPHFVRQQDDWRLIVDRDAANDDFWVTGANEPPCHVKHFNWKRDVLDHVGEGRVIVADIRNAVDGDPSPRSAGTLHESKGIEIGHVFKLGTKYTDAMGVTVLDAEQKSRPVLMGCYGIGVNRILAAALEYEGGHDDRGIIWPMSLAPYHVIITPIKYAAGSEVQRVADDLYEQLGAAGVDVLLDDRDERPGVKFNDADLIGIPLRITVGDKGLAHGEVEFKRRTAAKPEMVLVDAIVEQVVAEVRSAMP